METAREVDKEFVDKGLVAVVLVDFPLQNHGLPALMGAEAAHCAGDQDRYWDMHDALFERQSELSALIEADEATVLETLVEIADGIRIDTSALRACLDQQKYRPIVASLFKSALDSGIQVTPTLLIGQQPVQGFMSFEDLRSIIDRELSRAQGTPVAEEPTLGPVSEESTPRPAPKP